MSNTKIKKKTGRFSLRVAQASAWDTQRNDVTTPHISRCYFIVGVDNAANIALVCVLTSRAYILSRITIRVDVFCALTKWHNYNYNFHLLNESLTNTKTNNEKVKLKKSRLSIDDCQLTRYLDGRMVASRHSYGR